MVSRSQTTALRCFVCTPSTLETLDLNFSPHYRPIICITDKDCPALVHLVSSLPHRASVTRISAFHPSRLEHARPNLWGDIESVIEISSTQDSSTVCVRLGILSTCNSTKVSGSDVHARIPPGIRSPEGRRPGAIARSTRAGVKKPDISKAYDKSCRNANNFATTENYLRSVCVCVCVSLDWQLEKAEDFANIKFAAAREEHNWNKGSKHTLAISSRNHIACVIVYVRLLTGDY